MSAVQRRIAYAALLAIGVQTSVIAVLATMVVLQVTS